jgi:hypothetical protein
MNRRFWFVFVAGVFLAAAIGRAAGSVRIVPIARDDQVFVSFNVTDGYTDEVREAIGSGLRTTFTYNIELRMIVPLWVDRTIATAVVSTSDQYDNLTRRHTLSRTVDGRVDETTVTEDEGTVRRWLTTWDRLPLCKTTSLDPNRDYYVRITAQARPRGGSLLGWADAITGRAKFTFIP